MSIVEEARAIQGEIVKHRRWMHQHPELGFDLPETQAYVRGVLEEMGYKVAEPCEGGLLTQIGNPDEGACILLRADYDALPVKEETGLEFASTNGNMHACGHDAHAAMLLGAAKLLKAHESEIHGCVKLLFQPDEEGAPTSDTTGGEAVLAGGVLENPKVDALTALHVMTPDNPAGTFSTRCGTIFSSVDDIEINIQGKGCHGSVPHQGIDPINIACHIYQGVQNYIARELDPTEVCVATFGIIEAGRGANVVPDTARMLGTLRTQSAAVRKHFQERVTAMAQGIAEAFGGSCTVEFLRGVPNTYNDPVLTEELLGNVKEVFGDEPTVLEKPFPNTDDLAVLSEKVPTAYFILGATDENHTEFGMHHPGVVFNEDVFYRGSAFLAGNALSYLEKRAK